MLADLPDLPVVGEAAPAVATQPGSDAWGAGVTPFW
jgi:hypothetical protein